MSEEEYMRKTWAKFLAGSVVNYRLKKKIDTFWHINRIKEFS